MLKELQNQKIEVFARQKNGFILDEIIKSSKMFLKWKKKSFLYEIFFPFPHLFLFGLFLNKAYFSFSGEWYAVNIIDFEAFCYVGYFLIFLKSDVVGFLCPKKGGKSILLSYICFHSINVGQYNA